MPMSSNYIDIKGLKIKKYNIYNVNRATSGPLRVHMWEGLLLGIEPQPAFKSLQGETDARLGLRSRGKWRGNLSQLWQTLLDAEGVQKAPAAVALQTETAERPTGRCNSERPYFRHQPRKPTTRAGPRPTADARSPQPHLPISARRTPPHHRVEDAPVPALDPTARSGDRAHGQAA